LKRLPYRLPELVEADYVWITEGEKDADNLRKIGMTATCIAGGAKSPDWPTVAQYFRAEQHVTIIPDNDAPGEIYAKNAAQALFGKVASVRILHIEGLPEKGDVSDWLQGRTRSRGGGVMPAGGRGAGVEAA
jgi:DNA primase